MSTIVANSSLVAQCKASACSAGDVGLILVRKIPWRRKWQPTAAFLPGKSHGQRSLVGYNAWGLKESDTTERTRMHSFRKCSLNGYYNFNHYIITQPAYADSLKKPQ